MNVLADISLIDYALLGALLALFIAQVYWYSRYLAAPARHLRRSKKSQITNHKSQITEGVSLILCAHNESENLSHYLQSLLTQDYPEYEVIVVDDGSEDSTREVIESYMVRDTRLHMTFVPYGARVRSTKKLALTLAAKAARYDYLLLTDADCVPESKHWISEMMAGFEPSAVSHQPSVVLGFSPYFEQKGHINRLVRFDTLFNGLHYLGAAICGHPYMGVGRNLAYRKALFFDSGGFTHMMDNRAGDDDLFVNHVATKTNTAVVLSRDSYVWSLSKTTMKDWWQQKRRHLSVSPSYKGVTQFRLTLEPLTRGLFYAAVIAIIVYACLHYRIEALQFGFGMWELLISCAVGLFLTRWILQTAIINVSARRMGLRRFGMCSILWFDIVLPLVNLYMLIVPKRMKKW